ncbi:MAG: hypothetical protein AB3N23_08560 [Paracoccaceae bacterium]
MEKRKAGSIDSCFAGYFEGSAGSESTLLPLHMGVSRPVIHKILKTHTRSGINPRSALLHGLAFGHIL